KPIRYTFVASASAATGARARPTATTTASRIRRMGTSWRMAGGSLAERRDGHQRNAAWPSATFPFRGEALPRRPVSERELSPPLVGGSRTTKKGVSLEESSLLWRKFPGWKLGQCRQAR